MNTNDYIEAIEKYKALEAKIHVNLDDIINKVTQEVIEIIDAHKKGDIFGSIKESQDALINICSAVHEFGIVPNLDYKYKDGHQKVDDLVLTLGRWNSIIQGYRGKYSRDEVSLTKLENSTNQLIGRIVPFGFGKIDIGNTIETNTQKLSSRLDQYIDKLDLKEYIESYSDFPKKGIDFKDVGTILNNPDVLDYVVGELAEKCRESDVIVGLDARGFIFGSLVANYLSKPFVMIRKAGKLPGNTESIDYGLEYGRDTVELQSGKINSGDKVSVIDDLLATGGTADAAINLIEKSGGKVQNLNFVISLDEDELIGNQKRVNLENYEVNSLVSYS